tara:strand:- start:1284 stop:1592 length:309 start_codon:yes stop_codon:yes gene_type:complete
LADGFSSQQKEVARRRCERFCGALGVESLHQLLQRGVGHLARIEHRRRIRDQLVDRADNKVALGVLASLFQHAERLAHALFYGNEINGAQQRAHNASSPSIA